MGKNRTSKSSSVELNLNRAQQQQTKRALKCCNLMRANLSLIESAACKPKVGKSGTRQEASERKREREKESKREEGESLKAKHHEAQKE